MTTVTDDISTIRSHVHPVEIGTTAAVIFVIMIICLVVTLVGVTFMLRRIRGLCLCDI